MNNLKEKILEKIKKGEIKMRPRIYFIIETLLLLALIFLIVTLIIFLISFILFSLKMSGMWYLPRFGFMGIGIYLKSMPWLLIAISLILILILEILAKKFSFVWKRPIFYSLIIIILISLLGVFLVEKISFHPRMFLESRQRDSHFMSPIYRDSNLKDIHRGVVEEILEDGFIILNINNDFLKVSINRDTRIIQKIEEKDTVVVFGKKEGEIIKAIGVYKVDDNFKYYENQLPRPKQRNKIVP